MILPRSPWEQSLADTENEGVPTEDKVAEIFDAMIPLLPTPHITTFDLHLWIALTASSNDWFREFLSFLRALICKLITSFPIWLISLQNFALCCERWSLKYLKFIIQIYFYIY